MTASYLARLFCISLAAFYLLHLAFGAAMWIGASSLVRWAERMRPRAAARFLLAMRLLPAGLAAAIVAGLCVPSYLWLEPAGTGEAVGVACLTGAGLSVVCGGIALWRALRAASRSAGYIRYCQMVGRRARLLGDSSPAWVVEGRAPFLVLAGIVRPRLMISTAVVNALPPEQLAAALRHEHAHEDSRDNLKRLMLLLAPDLLPFCRGFGALERAWARFTEWAADDCAVAGDSARSLSLASALVRVARMGACPQQPPLVTSLLAETDDLEMRVERLLRGVGPQKERIGRGPWAIAAGAAAAMVALVAQPATFYSVHRLLEHLTK